jgi:mannose-6-phosphate isomerase-like protein (cupin superfamily)
MNRLPENKKERLAEMKKILWMAVLIAIPLMAQAPLAQRIGHGDWSKARVGPSHGGAGSLGLQQILPANAIYGLQFMHYGPLEPKSSIGAHFHNDSEEMFLILSQDCQFTINGQTAALQAPVGVPCQLKHEHAVYNPNDVPAEWVNFNVRMGEPRQRPTVQGWLSSFLQDPTGTFNIDDDRVGARLEPHPTFVNTGHIVKETARQVTNMDGGKGSVRYRRLLGPSVFETNWAYVDYYSVPPGASIGPHFHNGVEEVYLVIKGVGSTTVNNETAALKKGDAVPIKVKEIHSFENTGTDDFDLIVYGVALVKGKLDINDVK